MNSQTGLSPADTRLLLSHWFPALLLATAIFVFAFPTPGAFLSAILFASAATLVATYVLVLVNPELRLIWVLADGLLLGYVVGAANTGVGLWREQTNLAEYFGRPQAQFSNAIALVLVICALLFFLGALEPPLKIPLAALRRPDYAYIFMAFAVAGAAFATGGIGYMGVDSSNGGHISPVAEIAGVLLPVLPALTVLLSARVKFLQRRPTFVMLLAIEFVVLVPLGRRVIIYSMAVVAIAATARGWSANRLRLHQKLLILLVAGAMFYGANTFFYAMRHIRSMNAGNKKMSLVETISEAYDFLSAGKDESFEQDLSKNLRDRTFVLRYLSDMLDASWTHTPLFGKDALFCVSFTIPSAIYPDKQKILDMGMEETLVNPEFGLYVVDEANSIVTTGIADFGVFGAFLYPLLLASVLHLFCWIVSLRAPAVLRSLVILCVVFPLLQVEVSGSGSLVRMRDLTVLMIILLPIDSILIKRKKTSPAAPPVLSAAASS